MPTYVVTGPDGKRYRVQAPEGATEADIKARVQGAARPKAKPTSFWQGVAEDLGNAGANAIGYLAQTNPILGVAQAGAEALGFDKAPTPRNVARATKRTIKDVVARSPYRSSTPGKIVGSIIGSAPTMLIPGGALAQGAAAGALLTDDADDPTTLAKDVALGAVAGKAGELVGKSLGRFVGGQNVNPKVRLLADEGVVLTPGQRAGKGSLRNVFEDKVLGSLPLVSDIPEAAMKRGQNDLRVAVANRVLAPINTSVPLGTKINSEAMGQIQGQVYGALDDAAKALTLQADNVLLSGVDDVVKASPRLAGPEGAKQVAANATYLRERLAQGGLRGNALRGALGEIRAAASSAQGETAKQLWGLHDEVVNALERQNTGDLVRNFANARESATLLRRMEDAASKATGGEFGPTQLLQAARRRGFGTTTGKLASGEARLQDLAEAAADVMRNTTANSGTVPRALAGGAVMTGGAPMVDPTLGALTVGSLAAYVPGVDRALQRAALERPEVARTVGEWISRNSPYLGLLGSGGALALPQQ